MMRFPWQIYAKYKNLDINYFINIENLSNTFNQINESHNWNDIYKESSFYLEKLRKSAISFWILAIITFTFFFYWMISLFVWLGVSIHNNYLSTPFWCGIFVVIPLVIDIIFICPFSIYYYFVVPKYLMKLYSWKIILQKIKECFKDDEIVKQKYPNAIKLLFWYDEFYKIKNKLSTYQILHAGDPGFNKKKLPYWFKFRAAYYWPNITLAYAKVLPICVGMEIYLFINKFAQYMSQQNSSKNEVSKI